MSSMWDQTQGAEEDLERHLADLTLIDSKLKAEEKLPDSLFRLERELELRISTLKAELVRSRVPED